MKSFRTKPSKFLTYSTAIRNFGQNPANFGHFPPYIFLLGHFPSKNFGQNPAKNFGHLPAVNFGQSNVTRWYWCSLYIGSYCGTVGLKRWMKREKWRKKKKAKSFYCSQRDNKNHGAENGSGFPCCWIDLGSIMAERGAQSYDGSSLVLRHM